MKAKKSGWKRKVKRGLAAACLTIGLVVAGWGGASPARAVLVLPPQADVTGSVNPNHALHDVYVGFSYYLNTSGQAQEVFEIADSIAAGATISFSGKLYGDIDWSQPIEYAVLGVYDNGGNLVTVGFDQSYATNSAIGHSWEDVFTNWNNTDPETTEDYIADALESGDTETLGYFLNDYFDDGHWADNGEPSALVKFSNGTTGGTAYADASPVPIPPAILLLGSGLLGLVAMRRRASKA